MAEEIDPADLNIGTERSTQFEQHGIFWCSMNFLVLTLDSLKHLQGSAHSERLGRPKFNIISDVIKMGVRVMVGLYWDESDRESDMASTWV